MLLIYKSIIVVLLTYSILTVVPVSSIGQVEHIHKSWGSTNIDTTKLRFTWTINNFSFSARKQGDKIISPTFSAGPNECKWNIQIHPKGDFTNTSRDSVSLFLKSVSCNSTVNIKIGIINYQHKDILIQNYTRKYQQDQVLGFKKFVSQDYLLNNNNNFLKDNKLTIFYEITALRGSNSVPGKYVTPKRHLGKDMELLLEDEIFSDVVLSTDRKKFKAHKGILAARSPVFREIFEEDKHIENLDVSEITNTDHEVFKEILRYIYTDKVSNLNNINTSSLLAAAESYQLTDLKTLCENQLRANLALNNAVEFFILGDKYHAENLKMEARDLIITHISDLENFPDLKSLVFKNPYLSKEVFDFLGYRN